MNYHKIHQEINRELESLSANYELWAARQKQDFLWEQRIIKSQYDCLPPLSKIDVIGLFFTVLATKVPSKVVYWQRLPSYKQRSGHW
jgi:hypothetical protein